MSQAVNEAAMQVVVSSDQTQAELVLPARLERDALTPEMCELMLRQARVEITASVQQAVVDLLAQPPRPGVAVRAVVARATLPFHGRDGRVEWLVQQEPPAPEPAAPAPAPDADAAPSPAEPHRQSHYSRSAFVMVRPGDVIGRIHPPTTGEDGRDVTGRTMAARSGREASLKLDETILRDGKGQLIAQQEGVLVREAGAATIRRLLEIPDYVDFSTGNINFTGDVVINRGIRDLFVVKATGDVEVRGLIEAATIECTGDLRALGGFAGRERGTARVGRNLVAKYLDNIEGEVRGDLQVDREIINCDITVHGAIDSPHGSVLGGRLAVTGSVTVGTIGSPAGVPTQIVIGSVLRLEPLNSSLTDVLHDLQEQKQALEAEREQLVRLTANGRATASDRERETELIFELDNISRMLRRALPTARRLGGRIESQRTVDVRVERRIHAGAVICLGDNAYQLTTEIKGPVRIHKDGAGALVYARGDSNAACLLLQVADLQTAA